MDIFSVGVLNRVVEQLVPEFGYMTQTFFPGEQIEQGTVVHMDVRKRSRRISPFVSPYVQGQIVEKVGFTTQLIEPAYIKDKRVFDPNTPFVRSFGEPLNGNLSPQARLDAMVRNESQDQLNMLNRRLEVMAAEVVLTGKLTIEGELYPRVQLDFKRDTDLTVNLSGAAEWGDTGVGPLTSLRTWASLVFSKSGIRPRRVTMTQDAFELFMASDEVTNILERFRAQNTVNEVTQTVDSNDGYSAGSIGGFDLYVYGGTYIDPLDNTEKSMLPPYTVILGDNRMQGYKAFAAIRDEAAGLQARRQFQKSWVEQDPPVRYLMMQSAPIMAPLYPDAVLAATVKQAS